MLSHCKTIYEFVIVAISKSFNLKNSEDAIDFYNIEKSKSFLRRLEDTSSNFNQFNIFLSLL